MAEVNKLLKAKAEAEAKVKEIRTTNTPTVLR